MNKDVICAIPWMHLNLEPDGKVIPCCLTSHHKYFVGDLKTDTIEEIWNSEKMKQLRLEMLQGKEPSICATCFNKEKIDGHSGRTSHNQFFKKVIDIIPEITLEDGTCTTMEIKYWDFRFSNLCNFKCRSCGPRYSSAWIPDAKVMGWENQDKVWTIDQVDGKNNLDWIDDQIHHVEKIYFAGGEPLLMDEHWYILDLLYKHKRFDVTMHYNTNASVLTYNKKNVLDYWKHWEPGKIEVWPSIDEIGERSELIRAGTVWSKVEANMVEMSKLDNILLRPGLTIGAWNVFRLPVIVEHLIKLGIIKESEDYKNWFVNLLQYPDHYHVSILPDNFRKDIIDNINQFIETSILKYNTEFHFQFSQILFELSKPFNEKAAMAFLGISSQVDKVRNENIYKVIPEMLSVKYSLQP